MSRLSWFRDAGGFDWPRILLAALACTVVVALGVVGATSATTFGPYNPSWDGASDLRERVTDAPGIEGEFASDTSQYQDVDPNATVAFIIAPDEEYEDEDLERVQRFVEDGGRLVVLENFGDSGNTLLRDLGADARLDGDILRDEQHHYRGPTMPVATGVENHTLTAGINQLTLNYATAVRSGNATVLIRTSEFAYLVEDAEEELDDEDDLAAYPVATIEEVGAGEVVVVGDPSITINVMLEQPDNAAFLGNLYTGNERVLFDLSHSEGLPPLTAAVLTFRGSPLLQVVIGSLGIGAVALLSGRRMRPAVRRVTALIPAGPGSGTDSLRNEDSTPSMSDEEQVAYLHRQYPDWDEERIERVIAGLNTAESEREDETNE